MTEIIELFPTPIYKTYLPEDLAKIISWFDKQEMIGEGVDQANFGQRSKNSYVLHEPEAQDLEKFILEEVENFATNFLGYAHSKYRSTQSWLSYKLPGQHHQQHTHPNSLISGVLYYGNPEVATPAIRFHKLMAAFNVNEMRPDIPYGENVPKYAQDYNEVAFEPGLLLLFPSYVPHSVPLNQSNSVRHSMAFNTVPKESVGKELFLTELKF